MAKDLNGTQTGMNERAGVDDPRPSNIRGKNVFPQSFKHPTTDRYGEWSPFYWAKCERGDVQNLATLHDLHTFTMKSPNGIDVNLRKSFARVNMEAIYPRNWERMFTIPTRGDDVPSNTRALFDVRRMVNLLIKFIQFGDYYTTIRSFVLLEHIVSNGGLFARFNMHLNYRFAATFDNSESVVGSIDRVADMFYAKCVEAARDEFLGVYYLGRTVFVGNSDNSNDDFLYVSPHRFVEMLRDNNIVSSSQSLFFDSPSGVLFETLNFISGYDSTDYSETDPSYSSDDRFLNIEPIIAYQLICAQFASNDFVDNIYSAQVYRDNMQSLFFNATREVFPVYLYNGIQFQYDVISAGVFYRFFSVFDNFSSADLNELSEVNRLDAFFNYFMNLFEYQRSLRYGDYFMAAKTQPLAVGEYSAQVQSNEVSAIDITRSIQMQRLLNRVNMVGRKLGNYLSGIFGGVLPEAPLDVPIFLIKQDFPIGKSETTNTGSAQLDDSTENLTTMRLLSSQDQHMYEVQIERPCYIIGMQTYECVRVYSRTIDRFAFHHDRYDDFIPEQQYIGDQEIFRAELGLDSLRTPYSYVLRYMEYKKRYSYASGGFIEYLPSWEFITDNTDGNLPARNFGSNFIRSSPSEFDRFYKSLTNYSLAGYFHFIVFNVNKTAPIRQMEYTPEILK